MSTRPAARRAAGPGPNPASGPLSEPELERLQALLDRLAPEREPLDIVAIDGYLCGVLLQSRAVPSARWLPGIVDVDGRPAPAAYPIDELRALLERRHAELDRSIAHRQWFDPWVYQLDDEATPSETVLPWVAGFAAAMEAFPQLLEQHEAQLIEPLATLYRHFDPDDLEDADALLEEIEMLELPADLPEAVEDLVRSVLLIADVSRPRRETAGGVSRRPGGRARPGPAPRSRSGRRG
jgi:uncharacterized protein